jgi:small subunit ribosomal protein S1
MSLGIKQSMPDPWNDIETKYAVGSKHSAKVRNFTNFGVFVELEEGVDGLIHISDLSWQKKIKHPSEFCKVGEGMDVIVLEIDRENRRISLGHKQLEEDPWNSLQETFAIGSTHEGTVVKKDEKGAVVQLPYGLEGYAPARHLSKEDGKVIAADETNNFMVIEFDRNEKRIVLSHTRIWEQVVAEEKEAVVKEKKADAAKTKKAVKDIQSKVEKTTLGDLGVLAELKKKMEDGEEG